MISTFIPNVFTNEGSVYLLTKGTHDNIVSINKDTDVIGEMRDAHSSIVENNLRVYDLEAFFSFISSVDIDNLKFLLEGFSLNSELAAVGTKISNGIGKYYSLIPFSKCKKTESIKTAKYLCSAASEARMSGVQLPANERCRQRKPWYNGFSGY